MRGVPGFAAVLLLVVVTGSGACSDGEQPGGGTGGSSGSSGSAGSSGTSAGSSGSSGVGGTTGASGASGAAGSSGGADGGALDFLDRMAAAQCDAVFSCAELRKDFVIDLVGGREDCPALLKQILRSDPRNRERVRALAQGSLTLNDDALEECLTFLRSCSLGEGEIFHPCREVLEGTVALGGSCRFDDECAGDAYCMVAANAGCPGTCAARLPAGSACSRNGDCAGRYSRCASDSATGMTTCRDLTLVEGLMLGARCGDTSSTEVGVCRPELWCGGAAGQQVCRELIAPGGSCSSDFEVCAAGHFCNRQAPAASCQPVTVAREGEPCDNATLAFCDLYGGGLFCVAGRCERTGDGEVGTRCGTDTFNCDLGLYCDRTTDTCQPELAAGEPCTSRLQCSSGSCGNDSRCAAVYCGL